MKSKSPKVKVLAEIKLDGYRILCDAVERSVRLGYNRAHKHDDNPSEDLICQHIEEAVMNVIAELMAND